MEGLKPGRIVYYVLDEGDVTTIEARRNKLWETTGIRQANPVFRGEPYPAMITRVWDQDAGTSNLRVLLDGIDTHWATSRRCDPEKTWGTWHWMFEGQQTRYTPDRVEVPASGGVVAGPIPGLTAL